MEIIRPKLDIVFKRLFQKDMNMLKAFVGDLLGIERGKIQSIEVLNPENQPDDIEGKQSILDLKLRVDGDIVNVEIQLNNTGFFKERVIFYWAKIFTDQLKKGEKYKKLERTITINIVDFKLFDCDSPYSSFSLYENDRKELLTDKCSINFFELVKIDNVIDKNDHKKLWLQFLKAETEEDLTMLNKTEVPEIKQAVVFLHEMSADEEMKERARSREKQIRDQLSAIDYAAEAAEKRGREEGREEKEAKIVANLRKMGMPEEFIKQAIEEANN